MQFYKNYYANKLFLLITAVTLSGHDLKLGINN